MHVGAADGAGRERIGGAMDEFGRPRRNGVGDRDADYALCGSCQRCAPRAA